MGDEPEYYTAPQIAALANVSRRTVVRWCERGELRAYRYGIRGRWRIEKSAWEQFKREGSNDVAGSWQKMALALAG